MKKYISIIFLLLSFTVFSQSLEDYVQLALKKNPSINASYEEINIAKEKISEVGSWNDTGISFGLYPLRPETRVGSQAYNLGLSQDFPWFGTYAQAKKVQKSKVKLKDLDLQLRQKNIRYKVAEIYYKLYQLQSTIGMLNQNKSILKVYEKMALGALENNRARMSDILRIRAEKNAIDAQIEQYQRNLETFKHVFNRLLNREINTKIEIPAFLEANSITPITQNVEKHPSLEKIKQLKSIYREEKKLINKQSKPKIRLGTNYLPVIPRTDAIPVDNGKDVWMINIGLKIPLFNKKYRSQLKQTDLKIKQINFKQQNDFLQLQSAVEQANTDLGNALIAKKTAQKNIKDIQSAVNADFKAYETGLLDYDRILRLQLQKIKTDKSIRN